MILLVFLIVILLGIIVGYILLYNKFVRYKHLLKEAWSGIDVQLKKRYELIPNLVNLVKGYAKFERTTLEKVIKLRAEANRTQDIKKQNQLENEISRSLRSLFALVESYPDLKASKNFLELQKQLIEIENNIEMARRYYNGVVKYYNTFIESFPGILITNIIKPKKADYFHIERSIEKEAPDFNF